MEENQISSEQIITICDDEQTVNLLKKIISALNCSPHIFATCKEALEHCNYNSPDIVILDLESENNKGSNSLEVLRRYTRHQEVHVRSLLKYSRYQNYYFS